METYFLTFNNYYRQNILYNENPINKGRINGIVTDETGEPLIGANVVIKGTNTGTITNLDGGFELDANPVSNLLVISYIGYSDKTVPAQSNMRIILNEDSQLLDEIVVSSVGSRQSIRMDEISKVKEAKVIPVSVQRDVLNKSFVIQTPYSIPSNGKSVKVKMMVNEIDVKYHYHSVPKLDPYVYLIANIQDWEDYHLIEGDMNIYLKGLYKGDSRLNIQYDKDDLAISIGKDPEIFIEREPIKNLSDRKLLGLQRKVNKGWNIKVVNNKSYEIDIKIEDQYPISNVEEIKVELVESSDAAINEDIGSLTWNHKMNPKQNKELSIKYSVKYPSRKKLIVN